MRKTLHVNGTQHDVEIAPAERLTATLRQQLGLTGTKVGCGVGECGACTVLLDGTPVMACLTLTATVQARVTTVEGLPACRHDLGRHFAVEGGFQCGFCTPGQIVSAHAYVHSQDASPEEESVAAAMNGNVCRCTGYAGVLRAVRASIAGAPSGGRCSLGLDGETGGSTSQEDGRHADI